MVYRTGATRGDAGDNVLAYVVEVSNGSNIRDMVFVDASTGKLVNRYSMIHDALDRHVFEAAVHPGRVEVWAEGDPFPGDAQRGPAEQGARHGRVLLVLPERLRP